MVGWSKLAPELQKMPCRTMSHPWTDSCLLGLVYTWFNSCVGSVGFFSVLYLCQYLSAVLKKKKTIDLKDYLVRIVRSTVFGATVSAGTFASHCILRKIFGGFSYYSLVFIPACFAGLGIFLEHRKGQELTMNAFANCALELWLRKLERSNVLKWSPNTQTLTFMTFSALLSSLMNWTNFDLNYFWFFIPPKGNKTRENESQVCFHKKSCSKHISNLFAMYFTTGLLVQLLRLCMKNLRNPKTLLLSLKSPSIFKLAAFLGGYVVIYQAIRCFLYQKEKKYSLIHDVLAGFLAGVAFRFQPTPPIFNSAIITTIQILTELACQRKLLPNLPYLEMVFPILCGVLFHTTIILPEHCPQMMLYITSSVTNALSDRGSAAYKAALKKISN